jgi:hypothetical protein
MNDWFEAISTTRALSSDSARELSQRGFTVIPDAVPPARFQQLRDAYDDALSSASGADLRVGSTTTRLGDFVNRGEEVDAIYTFPPLLDACCRVIDRPFKLSSLHARTLRPRSRNGKLHVDVQRGSADWPLVGFILMVDDFRPENGATRFVPGSHRWPLSPQTNLSELPDEHPEQVQACGVAGSLIIFNGSTWHDHAMNTSDAPRRSLQGAFIPRDGKGEDFGARLRPETRARLTSLAQYVLAIGI